MKVLAYLRVSTTEQADSGLSLSHQRQKATALADLHDWELRSVIEDAGVSASSMNRAGLQDLLCRVRKREVGGVVVYKLDRLTRSMKDLLHLLEQFNRYSVRLVSVCENLDTSTANGRFFIQMLGAISEWERSTISERTKAAAEELRRQGKRFSGNAPYGWEYRSDGSMVEVPGEQETLRVIAELSTSGLSLNKIGLKLDGMGRKPRTAKRWHPKVIASLKKAVQIDAG